MPRAVPLHYDQGGDGPPVVIAHGLFGSSANWRSFAKKLRDSMRVIVPDMRNHGHSPHDDVHDYPAMAADLVALLDELSIRRAACVGHSMGGKAVMQLAIAQPERVTRIVALDIGPYRSRNAPLDVLDALLAVDLSRARSRDDVDAMLSRHIEEPRLRAFLLMGLTLQGEHYRWRFNLDAIAANWEAIMGEIQRATYGGPTLFVRGELSDEHTSADTALLREWFPRARLETIAGAGHWLHADRPAETLAKVRSFLEKDDVRAAG